MVTIWNMKSAANKAFSHSLLAMGLHIIYIHFNFLNFIKQLIAYREVLT